LVDHIIEQEDVSEEEAVSMAKEAMVMNAVRGQHGQGNEGAVEA